MPLGCSNNEQQSITAASASASLSTPLSTATAVVQLAAVRQTYDQLVLQLHLLDELCGGAGFCDYCVQNLLVAVRCQVARYVATRHTASTQMGLLFE